MNVKFAGTSARTEPHFAAFRFVAPTAEIGSTLLKMAPEMLSRSAVFVVLANGYGSSIFAEVE
jgi:hypothetical protein